MATRLLVGSTLIYVVVYLALSMRGTYRPVVSFSGGQQFPRYAPAPAEPSGQAWDEDKVAELYPKLADKYGYRA